MNIQNQAYYKPKMQKRKHVNNPTHTSRRRKFTTAMRQLSECCHGKGGGEAECQKGPFCRPVYSDELSHGGERSLTILGLNGFFRRSPSFSQTAAFGGLSVGRMAMLFSLHRFLVVLLLREAMSVMR